MIYVILYVFGFMITGIYYIYSLPNSGFDEDSFPNFIAVTFLWPLFWFIGFPLYLGNLIRKYKGKEEIK